MTAQDTIIKPEPKIKRGLEKTTYEGGLRNISAAGICGWAWDRSRPYEPINVQLYIGETLVAGGPAAKFDRELALNQKGNGCHLFEFLLDRLPVGEGPFEINLLANDEAGSLCPPLNVATRTELEALLQKRNIVGKIEGIKNGALTGWAADLDSPENKPAVSVLFNGASLAKSVGLAENRARLLHDDGLVLAWRFSVALPREALNGQMHQISVTANGMPLQGSPLSFGPTEATGQTQSISALAMELAELRERVGVLPPNLNTEGLIDVLSSRVMDRVDMLMAIYRDGVEQELGMMRSALINAFPIAGDGSDPLDVITYTPPQRETGQSASRQSGQLQILFHDAATLPLLSGSINLSVDHAGKPYGIIFDTTELALPQISPSNNCVVIEGRDATTIDELLGWEFAIGDQPVLGRYSINDAGGWVFVGQMTRSAPEKLGASMIIRRVNSYVVDKPVNPPSSTLSISSITFSNTSIVDHQSALIIASAAHIGGLAIENGWQGIEISADSARYRWFGHAATVMLAANSASDGILTVVGENSMENVGDQLSLNVNGETLHTTFARTPEILKRWRATAIVPARHLNGTLAVKLSVPANVAYAPASLGNSGDTRILSYSVRSISVQTPVEGDIAQGTQTEITKNTSAVLTAAGDSLPQATAAKKRPKK
jgi:hypothetical protein